MAKQKRIVNVTSRNGKLYAIKDSDESGESKSKLADACKWFSKKKDAYGMGMLGLGLFGVMIIQALFLGLFSYFWYGKDITSMLGFFGYLVTLDILSFTIFIPILGSVLGFIEFFYWDEQILAFFEIPSDCLTMLIKICFLIAILVGNIISTLLVIYWRMNKEKIQQENQDLINKMNAELFDGIISYRKSDKMVYKLLIWSSIISGIILILIPIVTMIYNGVYILTTIEIYMLIIGIVVLLVGITILILWRTRNKSSEEISEEIKEKSMKETKVETPKSNKTDKSRRK